MNIQRAYHLKVADIPFVVRFDKNIRSSNLMRVFDGYESTQKPFFKLNIRSSDVPMQFENETNVSIKKQHSFLDLTLQTGHRQQPLGMIGCLKRGGSLCLKPALAKNLFYPFLV